MNLHAGWGRTVGGGDVADLLQQAMLPVGSPADCREQNAALGPVDEASMICGGSGQPGEAGGCQGDSGGREECGKWVLRGIVSWGHSMCKTTHYTVFARDSSYINWINGKMNG